MNLVEILKAQGISDEVIKAVQTEMKNNKIFTAGEENLDVRYGKLKAEHESLTQQYTEASGLIAELKNPPRAMKGFSRKSPTTKARLHSFRQSWRRRSLIPRSVLSF